MEWTRFVNVDISVLCVISNLLNIRKDYTFYGVVRLTEYYLFEMDLGLQAIYQSTQNLISD